MKKIEISENIKNIGKISSGTLVGQVISIISIPIITRLYGAEIIGYWALFNSIAMVVNSFSDLGLTNAIMIKDSEEKSHQVYKVVTTVNLFISLIATIFISFFYKSIEDYSSFFIAVTIGILIITLQQIQISYTWLNKNQKYNVLMKNPILSQLSVLVISIPLAYLGQKRYGYFIGVIAGQIFTLINMKHNLPKQSFSFNYDDYKEVFNENKNFIIYQLPTTILTNLKNQMPTFLLNFFFGATMLGYYSISMKILNIPINLLSTAIGRVYFSTISKMKKAGQDIGKYTFENLKKSTLISIIPMTLLIVLSDTIVWLVLGETNVIASDMIKITSVIALFNFFMLSLSGIYIVLNKQKYALYSVIAQMIAYFIAFSIGKYVFDSVLVALIITSILYSIIQIIYFSYIFKAMNIAPIRYIRNILFSLFSIFALSFMILRIISLV